jgi:hypothetical protein
MLNIDKLLERYWEAETTLEEEAALKAYFESGEVADQHKEFASLFGHFNFLVTQVSAMPLPELVESVDTEAKVRTLNLTKWIGRVAAIFAIVAASTVVIQNNLGEPQPPTYAGKYTHIQDTSDPQATEEAMAITKEALAFLSKNLNKSSNTIKANMKSMQKADIFKD